MRYSVTIFIFIIYSITTFGQSLECSGVFATNNINDFKNSFGYNICYNFKMSNNNKKISLHFSQIMKHAIYDEIRKDEESNGPLFPEYYFNQFNSENIKYSLSLSFSKGLLSNESFLFFIGSSVSLNYFTFDKHCTTTHYRPYPDNFINISEFQSKYSKNNKIGLDLFAEFELKSFVAKKINVFSRINYGLMTYGTFARLDGGWNDPWLKSWLTINMGLKYYLKKE